MAWYGKIIGALIGYVIGRGLLGAIIGFIIGHQFDKRMAAPVKPGGDPHELRVAFFRATFQVMGRIAKSDGRVTEEEIRAAREAMGRFRLGDSDRQRAIDLFTEGKNPDFPLSDALEELDSLMSGRADLRRLFVQIQLETTMRAGGPSPAAREILARVCTALHVSSVELAAMEAMMRMGARAGAGAANGASGPTSLADAYSVLGVKPAATDREVTLAYRRQMSQNHPDKLVANGLPESMIEAAQERTRQILEAYERIRRHRGMK